MCETCGCSSHDHSHTHVMLPVQGMACEKCSAKLEAALNALPGVHATADHKIGAVSLLLHEEGDLAQVKETILDLGFDL